VEGELRACTEIEGDNMRIPLVDLRVAHRQVEAEIADGWATVVRTGDFVAGGETTRFEEEFARFQGVAHCVGVANGTDAIELALRAAGVRTGDEVIVPANTFIATAAAARRAGADIGVVDVDPATLLMDPESLRARVTARTRAVIPVHLFGQMAPVESVLDVASDFGAVVVEDAAQAQGARRHGRGAGSFGIAAGVSFYPGKNLGAYGDAGAVLTGDADVAERVRLLGNHGSPEKYVHSTVGFNSRMDTLQAVVLRAKLARLATWNEERRLAAARYDELLAPIGDVQLPATLDGNEHVWHLYVIQVDDRDAVLEELNGQGIGAGVHYPTTIHRHAAFADLGLGWGTCPVAERAAERMLSLPLFPGITESQQEEVVDALVAAIRRPQRRSA
jgi:dTDP-4-amino-4,6-dideoxygalactose transaminase